jgi:hypothetical protein
VNKNEIKTEVTKRILEMFQESYENNDGKELRLPFIVDDDVVEAKVVVSVAKTPAKQYTISDLGKFSSISQEEAEEGAEPTKEEIDRLSRLMRALGV